MANIFKKIGTSFTGWKDVFKRVNEGKNKVTASLTAVQNEIPVVTAFVDDTKIQVEKLNFKNKPHIARINEAQARIQNELQKGKKIKH
jgi:hypothetical protein